MILRRLIKVMEEAQAAKVEVGRLGEDLRGAPAYCFLPAAAAAADDLVTRIDEMNAARENILAPHETCFVEFPVEGGEAGCLWLGPQVDAQQRIARAPSLKGVFHGLIDPLRNAYVQVYFYRTGALRPLCSEAFISLDIIDPDHMKIIDRSNLAETWDIPPWEMEEITRAAARKLLACFALLGARNIVVTERHEPVRLNAQRARKGKSPLKGYDEVRLNLDVSRALGEGGGTRGGRAPGTTGWHRVRTHLRLLQSGAVVVVRPHSRGNRAIAARTPVRMVAKAGDRRPAAGQGA